MINFYELALKFYGIRVPLTKLRKFKKEVMGFIEERISIETAILLACEKLNLKTK